MSIQQRLLQILRFLGGGSVGISLYYVTLYVLTKRFHLWYIESAVIGSVVNYSCNFTIQKFWTFRNKNTKAIHRQIGKYLGLVAFIFVSNLTLLYLLKEYAHLPLFGAQALTTIVLTVIAYLVSKRIFAN